MNGTSPLVPVQHYVDCVLNLSSFLLNAGLLCIVHKHTPERLKPYKNVIRVTCFADMFLSAVYFICQPIILLKHGLLIYISNGFFARNSPYFDHCVLTAFGYAVFMNNLHIPVPFVCRYLHLCRNTRPTGRGMVVFSAALCTVSLVSMYTTWHLMGQRPAFSQKAIEQVVASGFFGNEVAPFVFGSTFLMPEGAKILRLHLGIFAAATALAYITVFFTQARVVRKLALLRPSMLSGTRKMHGDLNRALIALALCPMVTSALPLTFFIVDIFIASDEADNLFVFACTVLSSIAFWNPITTCLLIQPYRTALIRYFRRNNHYLKSIPSVTAASK